MGSENEVMTHFAGVATEKPNSFDTGDVGVSPVTCPRRPDDGEA